MKIININLGKDLKELRIIPISDVHIGDNSYIENCIVESRDTLRANTVRTGDPDQIKVIVEKNFRYAL